jgi:hypothetical protein
VVIAVTATTTAAAAATTAAATAAAAAAATAATATVTAATATAATAAAAAAAAAATAAAATAAAATAAAATAAAATAAAAAAKMTIPVRENNHLCSNTQTNIHKTAHTHLAVNRAFRISPLSRSFARCGCVVKSCLTPFLPLAALRLSRSIVAPFELPEAIPRPRLLAPALQRCAHARCRSVHFI